MKRAFILFSFAFLLSFDAKANPVILVADDNPTTIRGTTWGSLAWNVGCNALVTPINNALDYPIDPNYFVALVIASADSLMTPLRINNVMQYLLAGRSVYIQCEKDPNNSMNQAFQQLVSALGGSFSWGATTNGYLSPMQVQGNFANLILNAPTITGFTDGCAGGGNNTVFPFVTYNGNNYGFSFCPPNASYGTIISTSDQSWVPVAGNGNTVINILYHLITPGLCTNIVPVFNTNTSYSNVTCYGLNNGTASATATGNFPPFTYLWSPGNQTTPTITGLGPGTYICTAKDSINDVISDTFIITEPPVLTNTTSHTDILCYGNMTGTATVNVSGGAGPYSYVWTPTGGNNATAINLIAGNYSCTVTDVNGCTLIDTFNLTQPASALTASTTQINAACGTGSASVNVSGGVPTYTYSWLPTGGNGPTATGLIPGTYTCTITDGNNCTLPKVFNITQPVPLTATISHTDVNCFGGSDGTATIVASGGTPPYAYSWSPTGGNTATAADLVPGTYTCTVTDADNCVTMQSATITQPASAMSVYASHANLLCGGINTGLASVIVSGGTPAYTYSWSPNGGNGSTASNLAAGNYTCTITDANNCITIQAFTLTEPAPIASTTSHADILCYGANNGIGSVTISGGALPYTYTWLPTGGNGPNATGLSAGTYTCMVTDNNNCQHSDTIIIAEPAALSASQSQTDVSCFGQSNGSAQVSITGGTAPYAYWWAPAGGTNDAANGLQAGTYTCTITDHNNCILSSTFDISQPPQLLANVAKQNVVCQNLNQGIAIAIGAGGTAPYSYLWHPGNSTDTIISGLGAGNDTCVITDSKGCTHTAVFSIIDTSQPFNYSIVDSALDCRSAWLGATKGLGSVNAVSYQWLFEDNTTATDSFVKHTFQQASPNNVRLVVTNAVGCHDTLAYDLAINNPMIADFTTVPAIPLANAPIELHSITSIYASAYYWDFGDGTTSSDKDPTKNYDDSGIYHICLSASDSNNCADTVCKDIALDIKEEAGIPTAFSPNGDGENDVLYIRGYRLKTVRLRIYNRWGDMVFETDTKERGWDGTYKGQPLEAQTFAYTLYATFKNGTNKEISGSITLLR